MTQPPKIDYGVIGIVIGHFLLVSLIIWGIRSCRRAQVAKRFGLHPDAVQFRCGLASWLCGCFAFWPVICCPLDGAPSRPADSVYRWLLTPNCSPRGDSPQGGLLGGDAGGQEGVGGGAAASSDERCGRGDGRRAARPRRAGGEGGQVTASPLVGW